MGRRKQLTRTVPEWTPQQLEQTTKWVLAGASKTDISEAITSAYPGVEPLPLILEALAGVAKSADFDSRLLAGFCLEATRDLYRRMLEIGDFSGALKALKQLNDLAERVANVWNPDDKDTPS